MRKAPALIVAAAALTTIAAGAGVASAHGSKAPHIEQVGNPGVLVVGSFDSSKVRGTSSFLQTSKTIDGAATVYVNGAYRSLDRPNRSYFTVAYGNGNCDPAQAFPVGPFQPGNDGRAILAAGVSSSMFGPAVDLSGTRSVSVRIGDEDKNGKATDQDGDGIFGGGDVVAVAGKPKIGLVKCDTHPYVVVPPAQ